VKKKNPETCTLILILSVSGYLKEASEKWLASEQIGSTIMMFFLNLNSRTKEYSMSMSSYEILQLQEISKLQVFSRGVGWENKNFQEFSMALGGN
jgi:hypothetical protein